VKLGLTPEGASTLLLPRFAGIKAATELLMLGDRFDAKRAEKARLINHVVEDGYALTAALEAATSLQALPAESLRITKRLLHRDKLEILQVTDEESELLRQRTHSAEAQQAICTLLEVGIVGMRRDPGPHLVDAKLGRQRPSKTTSWWF
jgi:enoyl-CoA hydratase/carnithine racemase